MTALEQQILENLKVLEGLILQMKSANPKPNLLPIFETLDNLTRQLPKNSDPSLLHYLHKKSYEKARLFLENRDSENYRGECRRD